MSTAANATEHREVEISWSPSTSVSGPKRARKPLTIRAYLPDPIADREFHLTHELADAAARAEIACSVLTPSHRQVGLDTVARQLLRSEAVASSRIEGHALSNRRLAKAEFAGAHDNDAAVVLGNVAAVREAIAIASDPGPTTRTTFTEIHRLLFEGTAQQQIAGLIREEQNWIGGSAATPVAAEFIPPPAEDVERLLDDLASFCDRTDLLPVLQAAVVHAHFETIHPFIDGNGRVGRTLIPLMLRKQGLIDEIVPPVSLFLAARSNRYIQGLTSYRTGDPDDWFLFFAEAVVSAAERIGELARAVEELQRRWREAAGRPRSDSAASRLIAELPTFPVLSFATAQEITGASGEACRLALNSLERSGVLNETTAGRRNRVWESVGLFALLDDFEHGASAGTIRRVRTRAGE